MINSGTVLTDFATVSSPLFPNLFLMWRIFQILMEIPSKAENSFSNLWYVFLKS